MRAVAAGERVALTEPPQTLRGGSTARGDIVSIRSRPDEIARLGLTRFRCRSSIRFSSRDIARGF